MTPPYLGRRERERAADEGLGTFDAEAETAFSTDRDQVLLNVVAVLFEQFDGHALTVPKRSGLRKVADEELASGNGRRRPDRKAPEVLRRNGCGMAEIVVAAGVLFHLHVRPVSRIQKNHVRTEESLFDLGFGHEDEVKGRRVLRELSKLRDAVIGEVACGKNAAEVLTRAVASHELIFDDEIDTVHKTLIDVGHESRSISHQLLGHASKMSDRLDRAGLRFEGRRTKRLLSTFSNESRTVEVLGFLFLNVFKSVRGNRERREETFNRERTESTSEDARATISLNDAASRGSDRTDRFLLIELFGDFDASLLRRTIAEGLEAVGIDNAVTSRLNFGFLLSGNALLLKLEKSAGELKLFFTKALKLICVGLRSLRHLAFDALKGVKNFFHFHRIHIFIRREIAQAFSNAQAVQLPLFRQHQTPSDQRKASWLLRRWTSLRTSRTRLHPAGSFQSHEWISGCQHPQSGLQTLAHRHRQGS
nr:MAG TPA: hypothetical protein [Caudoviricetes sp.]